MIAGAHVDSAKNSAFGRFVLSQIQSNDPNLQRFIEDTGVDPRTDVSEVVVATNGMPSASTHGLIAAHGTFSNAIVKLEASAQANGGLIDHLTGVDIIHLANGTADANSGGNGPCVALYTDAFTAVIGDCLSVQAALQSASPDAPSGTPLFAKAQTYRSQQDLWFTSSAPLGQFAGAVPPNLNPVLNSALLQGIQQASGGVTFASGSTTQGPSVQIAGEVLMDSPQNATSLLNVLNFFKGMIQMNNGPDPSAGVFASLLSNLQTAVNGSTLTASLTIPEATLEQLFESIHHQSSATVAAVTP